MTDSSVWPSKLETRPVRPDGSDGEHVALSRSLRLDEAKSWRRRIHLVLRKKNLNGFILRGIWVVYFMWGCFEHLSDAYIYVDGLLGQLSFVCHLFVREICYVGREMCRTEFGILALFLSRGIFLKISHFTPDRSDPSISILSSNWK